MADVVEYVPDEKETRIRLQGRVDTVNAQSVEADIQAVLAEHPAKAVAVDCAGLEYISSAGLRVLLRLKKTVSNTRLENVTSEIYEIFEMTGFTEMMDIRKAYRVISVDGCEVIGRGANGEILRIGPDTVVKVFHNPDSLPEIQRERELARTAFVLGIPTAIPYDVVRIEDGRFGSVFELLNADSLSSMLIHGTRPLEEVAQMSIDLLHQIHSTKVKRGSMPSMKDTALGWADYLKDHLPPEQAEKLHSLIDAVPTDYHMLHGDYHLKNIMLQNGECLLIDMDTLCYGHPVFELASMFNAYQGFLEVDHDEAMRFQGIPYETAVEFWNRSLRLYLRSEDEELARTVEEKAMVVGYARILRRTLRRGGKDSEAGRRQIEHCSARLAELLPRVDSLVF